MKGPIILLIFSAICFLSYGQKPKYRNTINQIDSFIGIRIKESLISLHECDSVQLFDRPSEYKCWNYYYKDCEKIDIFKVSISFNGLPEELCFFYENNKVIKRQQNEIVNAKSKPLWTIYIKGDKEIFSKGVPDELGANRIEQAYYFLSLAIEYAKKSACR